ncbi:MAG: hypothetical protein FJ039_04210 [Chloroflexi bacterium]|nr:hypothetical protein [Chloroflexota bacterium]
MRTLSFLGAALTAIMARAACGDSKDEVAPGPTSAFGTPGPNVTQAANIPCEATEKLTYHVHSRLTIHINNQRAPVPAEVGIRNTCIFWLHTHDAGGVIHVEAPSKRSFTLGQFFQVWGQPLSRTALLNNKTDAQHEISAFVSGRLVTGDPAAIPLEDNADIVLMYGPPFPASPAP